MPDHQCGHGELVIPNTTLPLRLIDIPATLGSEGGVSFTTPTDWDFHVVSHTWSLSIREFSKTVGKSLGETKQLYNDAFQGQKFGDEAGYQQLMEFLKLLMSDGVKHVWFDALCINQMDNDEKSREIMHMGAYYKHSAGCYVANHGIGRSYSLLSQNEQGEFTGLPRWFSRVWTLQEFLLPTKLTFIVSSLNGTHLTTLVNMHITESSAVGLCRCCLETPVKHKTLRGDQHFISNCDEEILGSGHDVVICSRCAELPLIRRAAMKASPAGEQLYFVDRIVYNYLVILLFGPVPPKRDFPGHSLLQPHITHAHFQTWQLHLMELYGLLRAKCFVCNSADIGNLIRNRDCSVDEDRLLSVLCIFGLEGRMQVRAGETLEQQWAKLAQAMVDWEDKKTFLDFCIRDFKCAWQVGCSWIPNFRSSQLTCKTFLWDIYGMIRLRSAHVQLRGVTPNGALKLNGRVIDAILAPTPPWTDHADINEMEACDACQHMMCSVHSDIHRVHQLGKCRLEVSSILSIPLIANVFLESAGDPPTHFFLDGCSILSDPQFTYPNECIVCDRVSIGGLHLPFRCMHAFLPLKVMLVLWGDSFKDESSGIVMICMGCLCHGLHKVGVLQLKLDVVNAIFPATSSAPFCEFLLGGFGENVKDSLGGTLDCECLQKLCRPPYVALKLV